MRYIVSLNGKDYEVEVEQGDAMLISIADTPVATPVVASAPVAVAQAPVAAPVAVAPAPVAAPVASGEPIKAPMPGTIVKVVVSAGQNVKKGDVLMILEAMKMENEIVSPRDAVVGQVVATSGKSVATGETLLTLN